MGEVKPLSRGDRNRNRRLDQLRERVPVTNAVLGIDLPDRKQVAALVDHDARVVARRQQVCRAWQLGEVLDWAVEAAVAAGFESVTVACEATGHRWRVLEKQAAERGLDLVCVQSLLVWRAREQEDLTWDKSDPKDAMLIARLATKLHCYAPERSDETWSRLRHLGTRRARLLGESVACAHQVRELLECVWPAVLEAARRPVESTSWCAAMSVVMRRASGGDLGPVRRLGPTRFVTAVRRELSGWGGQRLCLKIVREVFDRLDDAVGMVEHRHGAFERVGFVLEDWQTACSRKVEVERRMLAVLDELELSELVGSIPGCRKSGRLRCWPRPGTRSGSPRRGRWSNMPVSVHGTTPRGPGRAAASCPGVGDRSCGSQRGGRVGEPSTATPCWLPATGI